jgi:hypothetical protein
MHPRRRRGDRPLSLKRAVISGIAILGAIGSVVTGFYLFDGQYQRRADAAAHAKEDVTRALWSQFGTTQLRQSFLEDRVYDLAARKAVMGAKFPASDEVSLRRYQAQLDQLTARLAELRKMIDEAGRH